MSKKYWKIGTGAISFVKKFAEITSNEFITGTKVSMISEGNLIHLVDSKGTNIYTFYSKSTANQYFIVWQALGFICKLGSFYAINTNLTDVFDLIELSKIYLKIKSENKKITRYRNTISINVLSYLKFLDIEKIKKMNYSKTRGELDMQDILDSISKYEKELAKDKQLVSLLKEKYDK